MFFATRTLAVCCAFQLAVSHSWVERINVESNGQLQVSPAGYARNNVLRTAPAFSDELMTYQLPPDGRQPFQLLPSDTICAPGQRSAVQSEGSPRLDVHGEQAISLLYSENGHITKPWNNAIGKTSPGMVYIYGTDQSQPTDALMSIHGVWNSEGTGGDQRGRLLYSNAFDDGKCYQYTDASSGYSPIESYRASQFPGPGAADPAQGLDLWCTATINLPEYDVGSVYTLYWVWDWPSENDDAVQPQVYTTCIDVNMVG